MNRSQFIAHVDNAIARGLSGESKLDGESKSVGGFSTETMRQVWNMLCAEPVRTYLEVGAFRGATAIAAACNNRALSSVVIDDFSQPFGEVGVRDDLLQNIQAVRPKTGEIHFIESDCWKAMEGHSLREAFDVFFYDGEHGLENTSKALPHFLPFLSEIALVIFDDTNWDTVAEGIRLGLQKLDGDIAIVREWAFPTARQDDPIWHNGVRMFLIEKLPKTASQLFFNHMAEEHGLTLLESEIDEIVRLARKIPTHERLVAVLGGGDWTDASVDHLWVPVDVDLDEEKTAHRKWYDEEYCPALRRDENPKHLSFAAWLIERAGARQAENDVQRYDET